MCRRVTCRDCGKPTYAGCGNHIEQVLGDVQLDARCSCSSDAGGSAPRWFKLFSRRRTRT